HLKERGGIPRERILRLARERIDARDPARFLERLAPRRIRAAKLLGCRPKKTRPAHGRSLLLFLFVDGPRNVERRVLAAREHELEPDHVAVALFLDPNDARLAIELPAFVGADRDLVLFAELDGLFQDHAQAA